MKKFIIKYSTYIYLGVSLGAFANITVFDYQYYMIVIPVIILSTLSKSYNYNEKTSNKL